MLRVALIRALTVTPTAPRSLRLRLRLRLGAASPCSAAAARSFSDVKDEAQPAVDATLLELLVCPLSKKPLRFEAKTNELINDELGIAYPVVDGIPNMIPQEARLLQNNPNANASAPPTQG